MRRHSLMMAVVCSACSASLASGPVVALPGQTVQLGLGGAAMVSKTSVQVVVRDMMESRCPSDVVCVQAGDAGVALTFSGAGATRTDTAYLAKTPHSATYGGYRFEFTELKPFPVSTNPTVNRIATLRVVAAN